MNKALVLVDVQNVYYTCRQAYKRNFNYNRFWRELSYNLDIAHAFAYAITKVITNNVNFKTYFAPLGLK